MSSGPAQFVQLGYVASAHGVRGALKVKLFNAESSTLEAGVCVRLCARDGDPSEARAIEIARVAPKPGSDMCRLWLVGVDDRSAADELRGSALWIDRDELPALDQDEFYLADLVGLAVVRPPDQLGQITGVTTNTVQDLLCVELDGHEWLLPVLAPFIVELAPERGEVVVDVDDEMLPESFQRNKAEQHGRGST